MLVVLLLAVAWLAIYINITNSRIVMIIALVTSVCFLEAKRKLRPRVSESGRFS